MKRTMAVILAGGEGERLSILSSVRAKPAVPFGGKYRIIDFTLSNCVNSDIDDVARPDPVQPALAQRPHRPRAAVGPRPDRGGVKLLQPYIARGRVAEWYRGTADAVLQNLSVIEHADADTVLVLAGDHIYKMDYQPFVAAHRRHRADVTIAVRRVPARRGDAGWASSRSTTPTGSSSGRRSRSSPRATSPRWASTSSRKRALRRWLDEDRTDFGGHVIPAMLDGGARVFGYRFDGYWQDVGTIQSLLGGQHGPPRRRPRARPLRQGLAHPHPVRGAGAGQGRPDRPGPSEPHQPRLRHRRDGRQLRPLAGRPGRGRAPSSAIRS